MRADDAEERAIWQMAAMKERYNGDGIAVVP